VGHDLNAANEGVSQCLPMRSLFHDVWTCKLSFQLLDVLVTALALFVANTDYHELYFVNHGYLLGLDGYLLVDSRSRFICVFLIEMRLCLNHFTI
jgi:hypothetical protein